MVLRYVIGLWLMFGYILTTGLFIQNIIIVRKSNQFSLILNIDQLIHQRLVTRIYRTQ